MDSDQDKVKQTICLTEDERKAIAALHRLASRWPTTLWLASMSGNLHVMRVGNDGKRVYHPIRGPNSSGGGVDQSFSVARVDIPNDGGDW